ARAHGHALNRHHHRVRHGGRLHVGGRAHTGTDLHRMIGYADLHLEVGDLFLRAGVAGHCRTGDLAHHAADSAVGIGVDVDARGVADVHVDDVVLVDVDAGLHIVEVRNAHHLGTGKLDGADHALADAAGQRAHAAVRGGVKDRLGTRVA